VESDIQAFLPTVHLYTEKKPQTIDASNEKKQEIAYKLAASEKLMIFSKMFDPAYRQKNG
jgi:hypothetical protein